VTDLGYVDVRAVFAKVADLERELARTLSERGPPRS
jgi:hypothetical protein